MGYEIIEGDCLEKLRGLPDCSVQCCVTSPPYFGLRDYGTATWEGGDEGCNHSPARKNPNSGTTIEGGTGNNGHIHEGYKGNECPKCGAIRIDSQIGLESTPEEYINKLVNVFREVWRVLKDV